MTRHIGKIVSLEEVVFSRGRSKYTNLIFMGALKGLPFVEYTSREQARCAHLVDGEETDYTKLTGDIR